MRYVVAAAFYLLIAFTLFVGLGSLAGLVDMLFQPGVSAARRSEIDGRQFLMRLPGVVCLPVAIALIYALRDKATRAKAFPSHPRG